MPVLGLSRLFRPLGLVVVAALAATLATLVAPAAPAAPAAPDPSTDWYELPDGCAGPARMTRQHPHGCRLTPWVRTRPTVMLWGDSHAWQQVPALIGAAKAARVNLTVFTVGSCPPAKVRVQRKYPGRCEESNALALRYVQRMAERKRPLQVLLGSNWAGWRQITNQLFVTGTKSPDEYDAFHMRMFRLFHRRTAKLFPALRETRVPVTAIGQTATCLAHGDTAPYDCTLPRRTAILHEGRTHNWLAGLTRGMAGDRHQIDVNGAFCGPKKCHGYLDGIYTWWDWGHLSVTRARTLAPYFVPLLRGLRG